MQEKLLKLKEVLQSTYLYTIYLFFVRNFRKAGKKLKNLKKLKKRIKKLLQFPRMCDIVYM